MDIPGNDFGFWSFWLLSSGLFGVALYVFLVWREVGGVRGFALMLCALCAAVITATFAISYSGEIHFVGERMILLAVAGTRIPIEWIVMIQQGAWFPLAVSLFLLGDLWVADKNSHRSITYRTYTWYARLRDSNRRHNVKNGGRA